MVGWWIDVGWLHSLWFQLSGGGVINTGINDVANTVTANIVDDSTAINESANTHSLTYCAPVEPEASEDHMPDSPADSLQSCLKAKPDVAERPDIICKDGNCHHAQETCSAAAK